MRRLSLGVKVKKYGHFISPYHQKLFTIDFHQIWINSITIGSHFSWHMGTSPEKPTRNPLVASYHPLTPNLDGNLHQGWSLENLQVSFCCCYESWFFGSFVYYIIYNDVWIFTVKLCIYRLNHVYACIITSIQITPHRKLGHPPWKRVGFRGLPEVS